MKTFAWVAAVVTAGAAVLVPSSPASATGSNCCVPHVGPGCDNPLCQQVVCSIAPHCCFVTWDAQCAALAQNFCGPLCTGGAPIQDAIATSQPPPSIIDFGSPAVPQIPADFFGPGSDPFQGVVLLAGDPPDVYTHDVDTLIQRFSDPVFLLDPPGSFGDIPIEIIALSLVSIDPITVTYNGGHDLQEWDVKIDLSEFLPPPPGNLQANKTHPNGGVFTSQFLVQPRFTFTRVDDVSQVREFDTAGIVPPIQLQVGLGTFVHTVSPNLNIVPPGPNSQWVPGILEMVPGDIFSQVEAPFAAHSYPSGVVHTVCPAYFKEGRCAVTSKTMPMGQVACATVINPDGTRNVRAPFAMDARFRDNCACCEYRQHVKGEFKLKGKKVPKLLEPGVLLDKNVFKEDGFGVPVPAGANQHYGHRNEPKNPAGDRYKNPAARGTGCNYAGTDAPGWYNIRAGTAYSIDLSFRGSILDTCNQLTLLPIHEWTVNCAGVALGQPDPLFEILIETVINGRGAVLGVYLYPGDVLTIVGSISNGLGEPAIDASEVSIIVAGLVVIDAPEPGPLPQSVSIDGGATAHALYDFDYPPGSPDPIDIKFVYGPELQEFFVDISAPCPADLDGDGTVGIIDFLTLLGAWGPCNVPCPPCPGDIDGDCTVGIIDFLTLLGAWGPCPL